MHNIKCPAFLDTLLQRNGHMHRGFRLDPHSVGINAQVKHARQAHVIRAQGQSGLLAISVIIWIVLGDFGSNQFRIIRDVGV